MKKLILISFILIFGNNLSAQNTSSLEGTPLIGWDSLKSLIKYPEIARRVGFQEYVGVMVKIDSLGNVNEVVVCGNEIFKNAITVAVKSTKWYPGSFHNTAVPIIAHLDLAFQIKNYDEIPKRKLLIIETGRAVVNKMP